MKKGLSVLVSVVLLLSALSMFTLPVSAASEGYYYYSISGGEATITDVDESISGNVTIPATLGGYPVTAIGYAAFRGCTGLTSVTIGDSVTTIGRHAFSDCTGLTSITIPDSVTTIGSSAFSWCTGLTSITIPDSVTSIGGYAFSNCKSLTGITIPDSVTAIGGGAFSWCTGLTSITIPDSVTTIGYEAFRGCTRLTSISIPDSVTSIGSYAFYGCSGLTDVYYRGDEADKAGISIDSYNSALTNATWHYNSCIGSAEHSYDSEQDAECNVCGFVRELAATHLPGDINGNGTVNNRDVIVLNRYLNDWGEEVLEAALDVNGDGTVNNRDVMTLNRYLNDWDVVIY